MYIFLHTSPILSQSMSQQLSSEEGKQVNYTQDSSFFSKEEELPRVGFEHDTL